MSTRASSATYLRPRFFLRSTMQSVGELVHAT